MLKEKLAGLAKRMFATAVCLGAAAFVFANTAIIGNAATKGKVIANAAKVRAQANTTSDQVGSVPKDGEVVILEEVNGADGKVWYKVSFDGDKTGYIRSDLMTKFEDESTSSETAPGNNLAPGVTAVNPVPAKVSGAQVRVRSSASTAGDIVTTLEKDSVVTVLGTATDSTGKIWYQITYNNINGFVRNDFVTLQGDLTAPEQQPVVDDPVDDPVIDEPDETPAPAEPVIEKKAMDTELGEDDVWYLMDYSTGYKYSIPELFEKAQKYGDLYNASLKDLKKQKVWIGILLAITFVCVIGATMVIMKFKDLKDAVEFGKTERETLEKRMNQKLKNRQQNAEKARTQGAGAPAGAKKVASAQGKTTVPQKRTVTDVSGRPASQGKPQANVQQRPAKPVVKEKVQFNEQLKDDSTIVMPAIPKTALNDIKDEAAAKTEEKVAAAPKAEKAPAAKPVEKTEAKPKQVKPKNFLEDDDDFEFEFLNWDGDK